MAAQLSVFCQRHISLLSSTKNAKVAFRSRLSTSTCVDGGMLKKKREMRMRTTVIGGESIKLQVKAAAQAGGKETNNTTRNSDIDTCTDTDYVPQTTFYKVEAILRPWSIPHVTSGLLKIGIRGVTVSDVKGFGAQGASPERQAGSEFSEDNFVSKVKMEIVVSKDQVATVIDAIIDEARTGEIGDGKIFVLPVTDIIRVRTGERGLKAERMAGGRAELLSGAHQDVANSD
uniref:TSA: Wollemia nobilis Ref_Wollemi_Transcript_20435_946 transcribed RNA sequence n=1 Tax=Wollemia nobilis TaxID=56998 RepID=A0A0C9S2A7_9CONI